MAKDGSYERIPYWIRLIWSNRKYASEDGLRLLDDELIKITDLLDGKGCPKTLMAILENACNLHDRSLSAPAKCYLKLGRLLQQDKDQTENVKATSYLKLAWSGQRYGAPRQALKTGWALALAQIQFDRYNDAKIVLNQLVCMTDGSSQPTSYQVISIQAHVELKLANPATAEKTAKALFETYGFSNLLATADSSTPVSLSNMHPANTLIRARVDQKAKIFSREQDKETAKEKMRDARKVWGEVKKDAQEILSRGESGRRQLQGHIEAATYLANEWEKFAKQISAKVVNAKEVRKEIAEMEKMLYRG
jgi:hypothetical protein